jgi:hypothetical protein
VTTFSSYSFAPDEAAVAKAPADDDGGTAGEVEDDDDDAEDDNLGMFLVLVLLSSTSIESDRFGLTKGELAVCFSCGVDWCCFNCFRSLRRWDELRGEADSSGEVDNGAGGGFASV